LFYIGDDIKMRIIHLMGFSKENLIKAGIKRSFINNNVENCIKEITNYVK
jgi:hypothetical protein